MNRGIGSRLSRLRPWSWGIHNHLAVRTDHCSQDGSLAETTILRTPKGIHDLRAIPIKELPTGNYIMTLPQSVIPKPKPPELMGNLAEVVPSSPPHEGSQSPSTPHNRESQVGSSEGMAGEPLTLVYQTIAHLRENAIRADGSRRPRQLDSAPPGMAALREAVGSISSTFFFFRNRCRPAVRTTDV